MSVINALKADPRTVDLRALVPHFYSLGTRILDLFEEEEIVDVLVDVRRCPISVGHLYTDIFVLDI